MRRKEEDLLKRNMMQNTSTEREVALRDMGRVSIMFFNRRVFLALSKWNKNTLEHKIKKKAKDDSRDMVAVMVAGGDDVSQMRDKNVSLIQENRDKTDEVALLNKKLKQLEELRDLTEANLSDIQTASKKKLNNKLKQKSICNLNRAVRRMKHALLGDKFASWLSHFTVSKEAADRQHFAAKKTLHQMFRTVRAYWQGQLGQAIWAWTLNIGRDRAVRLIEVAVTADLKKFYRKKAMQKERLVNIHRLNRVLKAGCLMALSETLMVWQFNKASAGNGQVTFELQEDSDKLREHIETLSEELQLKKKKVVQMEKQMQRFKDVDNREKQMILLDKVSKNRNAKGDALLKVLARIQALSLYIPLGRVVRDWRVEQRVSKALQRQDNLGTMYEQLKEELSEAQADCIKLMSTQNLGSDSKTEELESKVVALGQENEQLKVVSRELRDELSLVQRQLIIGGVTSTVNGP